MQAVVGLFDGLEVRVQVKSDTVRSHGRHQILDEVRIEGFEWPVIMMNHVDIGAGSIRNRCQLEANIAPTHESHALRHLIQI